MKHSQPTPPGKCLTRGPAMADTAWMQTWNLCGSVRMSAAVARVERRRGITVAGAIRARLENTVRASSS